MLRPNEVYYVMQQASNLDAAGQLKLAVEAYASVLQLRPRQQLTQAKLSTVSANENLAWPVH